MIISEKGFTALYGKGHLENSSLENIYLLISLAKECKTRNSEF